MPFIKENQDLFGDITLYPEEYEFAQKLADKYSSTFKSQQRKEKTIRNKIAKYREMELSALNKELTALNKELQDEQERLYNARYNKEQGGNEYIINKKKNSAKGKIKRRQLEKDIAEFYLKTFILHEENPMDKIKKIVEMINGLNEKELNILKEAVVDEFDETTLLEKLEKNIVAAFKNSGIDVVMKKDYEGYPIFIYDADGNKIGFKVKDGKLLGQSYKGTKAVTSLEFNSTKDAATKAAEWFKSKNA